MFNVSGQKTYPKWTNHFDRESLSTFLSKCMMVLIIFRYIANSILFTKAQRGAVIMSNIGIAAMVWGVCHSSAIWGAGEVIKYYGLPWLCVSHWCTSLLHAALIID